MSDSPEFINDENTVSVRRTCMSCGSEFVDQMSRKLGSIVVGFPMRVRDFKQRPGRCRTCRAATSQKVAQNAVQAAEAARAVVHLNWTPEKVREHFIENPPVIGQELLVLDTSNSLTSNNYAIVKIAKADHGKQRRIIIDGYTNGYSGQSFYRTGQNCHAPKGQVRLLPYHEAVGGYLKTHGARGQMRLTPEQVKKLLQSA